MSGLLTFLIVNVAAFAAMVVFRAIPESVGVWRTVRVRRLQLVIDAAEKSRENGWVPASYAWGGRFRTWPAMEIVQPSTGKRHTLRFHP